MAASLATADDVAVKWRPLSPAEGQQVEVLLEEASAKLRRAVPNLDARIASGEIDTVLARSVVTNAVLRVLKNPSGVTQQSAGPETASWSGVRATGEVTITAGDVADVLPVVSGGSRGSYVGTIWVTPGPPPAVRALDTEGYW
jgi:hypothetical protein